ncbi:glycosyltransferase family 1 protein [Stipitochalara longipes BDJ]|nr:glycosyltransferase family 1 protein [Stipitochalara longipes BDJ]
MASNAPPTYSEQVSQPANENAPPAYNEATRILDVSQDGFNTQAQVRDDGRLDIRINETDAALAKQIEQIRLDAQQQQQEAETPTSPITTYTSATSADVPPPLNIVIHVVGSRGDVQPFVALGIELKNKYNHRVRLATHGTFKKFVEENGLEFFNIGGDPAELMAFMVKNPGLIPGMDSLKAGDVGKRRKGMAEILEGCWRSCADADEAKEEDDTAPMVKPFIANAIIANPPSFAHIHCAEKLGIPLHLMFTMPWSPTHDFPHPIANIKSSNASGSMTNELTYTLVDMMTWQGLGDIINHFREDTLKLVTLSQAAATTVLHRLQIPYTYCWSPALIPKPKDWGRYITISGFYFLSLASNYQPASDLAEFLAAGPPPVYIGFGSIVVDDPNAMTKMIFEAVKKTGQRALVSKGWGGLGGDELDKPEGVFMLGNCPHDWLFQHVSAVVHHGGAGTTAAGIALGRPTVIVPFFGDQPFWGAMVARAGAGPSPIPYKYLTANGLAEAILMALKPETLERARELGEKIREEKGCEAGAASFHAQLNIPKLKCMMAPERIALWQISTKGSHTEDIRLSAFAAAVLGDAGILDVNQLKLYRPYEYPTAEHFMVSNMSGANPILGTMGSIGSAILHWPVNVAKSKAGIIYEPYKGARRDGWKGFGKGLGKGAFNFVFPMRGLVIRGKSYGMRALFKSIKQKLGSDTLSFILAAHFAQGFEEMKHSTEEQRQDVLRRWQEMSPVLKKEQTGSSSSSTYSLTPTSTGTSSTSSASTATDRRKPQSTPPTPSG